MQPEWEKVGELSKDTISDYVIFTNILLLLQVPARVQASIQMVSLRPSGARDTVPPRGGHQ